MAKQNIKEVLLRGIDDEDIDSFMQKFPLVEDVVRQLTYIEELNNSSKGEMYPLFYPVIGVSSVEEYVTALYSGNENSLETYNKIRGIISVGYSSNGERENSLGDLFRTS